MNWGKIFGWANTVVLLAASIGYLCQRDWRRAIYFAAAAVLNTTVIL